MAKTERVLSVLIVAGFAACLGVLALPTGPKAILAAGSAPVETPAASPSPAGDEVAGAPADADSSDPLTASVVSFQPSMRIIPSGNSTGIKLLTAQTAEGVPVAHELSEVLLSRMVTLSDNTPSFIADFDGDSELSDGDVDEFQRVWAEGDPKADLNGDGAIDAMDYAAFINAFDARDQRPSTGNVIQLHFTVSGSEGGLILGGQTGGDGGASPAANGQFEITLRDVVNVPGNDH